MSEISMVVNAALALGAMGAVCGGLLAAASRRFHVEVDERVEAVLDSLPGSNCGACGSPSCFSIAEAIAGGKASVSACVAGGQSATDAVAAVMGLASEPMAAVVSARHCGGGTRAERGFDYSGLLSCRSLDHLAGGDLVCAWGCFGHGDCLRACPFDAISIDERGLPRIDPSACTGCGLCVTECPRGASGLLALVVADAPVVVRCRAHDKPGARRRHCSACCIACRKCEQACPTGAITVVDRVAVIDYSICDGCGACVSACPQECIDLHGRMRGSAGSTDGAGPRAPGFAALAGSGEAAAP